MRIILLLFLLFIEKSLATPSITIATVVHDNDNQQPLPEDESCQLMDGFAIFIQLSLCFTALLTLIYKRSKEFPQRPIQVWYVLCIPYGSIYSIYLS
jgi:hypothetical protein